MNPGIFLQNARDRIALPEHWCKENFAQDRAGVSTWSTSPSACRWCLAGTLEKTMDHFGCAYNEMDAAINILRSNLPQNSTLQSFNDSPRTTHAMVLELLDKGIREYVNTVSV